MMIDTIKGYILILVKVTSTIQGHRNVRKQKFCCNYLTKFSVDLDGIGYTVETCWLHGPHGYLSCPVSVQGRVCWLVT